MAAPEVRNTMSLSQGEFATIGMLHDHATRLAEAEFAKAVAGNKEPFQCPFLWLIKTQRLLLTIETPWSSDDEKVRSMNMMRTYMAMTNATAYSFMHEAWMAVFNAPNVPKKLPYSVRGLPEDQREDVLLVWTFDRSDKHLMTRWGVKRAGTPRATLLARDDRPSDGVDHFAGRLFNLLKPPQRLPDDVPEPGDLNVGAAVGHVVVCPHCGKVNDAAHVLDVGKTKPSDDDVMLCVACGQWQIADSRAPGNSRKLTEAESFTLGFDPKMVAVRKAWLAARKELDAKEARS